MQVRGIVIASLQEFIKDQFGKRSYDEWEKDLPKSSRRIYENIILIDEWYSLEEGIATPLWSMCDRFYDGHVIGARYSGRFSALFGLRSKFKHLLVNDPKDFAIEKYASILRESYRPADLEIIDTGGKYPAIRITDFTQIDEYIENRIVGWIEKGLEFNSCLYNTVEVTNSLVLDDPYTEIVINQHIHQK
ncbi:MAG: hypothetical protein ACMUIE_10490 [Thermoplasmatota archaeon]